MHPLLPTFYRKENEGTGRFKGLGQIDTTRRGEDGASDGGVPGPRARAVFQNIYLRSRHAKVLQITKIYLKVMDRGGLEPLQTSVCSPVWDDLQNCHLEFDFDFFQKY